MAIKKTILISFFTLLLSFGMAFAALPSGVTLGEFRYGEGNKTIVGSISSEKDFLVFKQNTENTIYYQAYAPGFDFTGEYGYGYNIRILDLGVGELYKYSANGKGTSNDQMLWSTQININPYKADSVGTPETDNESSTNTDENSTETTKEPFGVSLGEGGESAINLFKTKGCSGYYKTGLLAGIPCDEPIDELPEVLLFVKNIINKLLLPAVGTLFLIMFMFGGIRYITSTGNPQRAESAKKILTAAIIGLIITILAYIIVGLTATILGGGIAK